MPRNNPAGYLPPEVQQQLLGQSVGMSRNTTGVPRAGAAPMEQPPQEQGGPSMTLREFERMGEIDRYDFQRRNPKLHQLFLQQEQAYQQPQPDMQPQAPPEQSMFPDWLMQLSNMLGGGR